MTGVLVPLKLVCAAAVRGPFAWLLHAAVLGLGPLVWLAANVSAAPGGIAGPDWPRGVVWLGVLGETCWATRVLAAARPLWDRALGARRASWPRLTYLDLALAEGLALLLVAAVSALVAAVAGSLALGSRCPAGEALAIALWAAASASMSGCLSAGSRTRPAACLCITLAPAALGLDWTADLTSGTLASLGLTLLALSLGRPWAPGSGVSST